MNSNLSNSSASCTDDGGLTVLYINVGVALGIVVVLCFMQRRKTVFANVCWGVPGLVVPVNLLITTPRHFVYAAIFGAMAGDLIFYYGNVVFGSGLDCAFSGVRDVYAKSFLTTVITPVVVTLLLSLKYLPIFACVHPPRALIGHSIGFIYICLVSSLNIYTDYINTYMRASTSDSNVQIALTVMANVPVYCCYIILVTWFLYSVTKDVYTLWKKGCRWLLEDTGETTTLYYTDYVKKLFRKRKTCKPPLWNRILTYIFPYCSSSIKLPLKFLAAVVVVSVFAFWVGFSVVGWFLEIGIRLVAIWESKEFLSLFMKVLTSVLSMNTAERYYNLSLVAVRAIAAILPLGPAISLVICVGHLVHLSSSVHRHIGMMQRGDTSFTYIKMFKPSNAHVSASWRYAGYQIGYMFAAFFIYMLVVWLLSFVVFIAYFFIRLSGVTDRDIFVKLVLVAVQNTLIPGLWLLFIMVAQMAAIKFIFIKSYEGKFVAIKHERIFNWVSYCLFFFNLFVGLFNSVLRILFAAGLGVLLIVRLDRLVIMKGFEFLDLGHKTYLGFLYMELAYNHPIVHAFVQVMADVVHQRREGLEIHDHEETSTNVKVRDTARLLSYDRILPIDGEKLAARNRWLLAYTLFHNPQLREMRVRRRENREEGEEEENGRGRALETV